MGSINSAISDDMDDYKDLCKKFNEKPQYTPDHYGNMLLDCYGSHAEKLKKWQTQIEVKRDTLK